MRITIKQPDRSYVGPYLWVPKSFVTRDDLARAELSYTTKKGRLVIHKLWTECEHHYRFPRRFQLHGPVPSLVDLRQRLKYQPIDLEDRVVTFLDERQERAWKALSKASEGVLKLACGAGKTALAIKKAVLNNGPFVIVCYDIGLIAQWEQEIRKFTDYKGKIGIIQGARCDWDRPVVITSIKTLIKRPLLPVEVRTRFRTVIFDEAHHCPASVLKQVLPIFWGDRIALTATPERADGMEQLLFYHIGPLFHEDISQPLIPRIYFRTTPSYVSLHSRSVTDVYGELSITKLCNTLAYDMQRNKILVEEVKRALSSGRKILVLTPLLDHVELLRRQLPEARILTGEVPREVRYHILKESQLVIATRQVAQEGLDAPDLDTIYFAFPVRRHQLMEQIIGRALRMHSGKKTPVIVIMADVNIRPMLYMCKAMYQYAKLRGWPCEFVGQTGL